MPDLSELGTACVLVDDPEERGSGWVVVAMVSDQQLVKIEGGAAVAGGRAVDVRGTRHDDRPYRTEPASYIVVDRTRFLLSRGPNEDRLALAMRAEEAEESARIAWEVNAEKSAALGKLERDLASAAESAESLGGRLDDALSGWSRDKAELDNCQRLLCRLREVIGSERYDEITTERS